MKKIVIFCRNIAADKTPFNDPFRFNGYQDLLLAIKAQGAEAYFATDMATYLGEGRFSIAYTTDVKCPVEDFRVIENVKADLVFEKGGFNAQDVALINPPFVHNIASSKAQTYAHFAQYQPLSIICHDQAQIDAAMEKVPGDLIVAKEPEGNGGHFVYIGTRAEVLAKLPGRYPIIIQQFMDTSVGIPGLIEGPHDFRVKIAGGQILGAELRAPAEGEHRANTAQGGQNWILPPEKAPAEVVKLAMKIDDFFKDHPRYYAIDFINTAEGWKVVELNSKPGLSPTIDSERQKLVEGLANYLIEVCQ